MSRPTIRTIASVANVSNCTVSRALRGDTHLNKDTRERIQTLAKKMGYEVNAYVSSWMAHVRSTKTEIPVKGNLAYLIYHSTDRPLTTWDTPRRQLDGAVTRARELGYKVEPLAVCRDGLSAERIRQILCTRAIKGILLPVSGTLKKIDLSFDSFACVAIGHHMSDPPLPYTSADHHMITRTACMKLHQLGYQRIGLILNEDIDQRLELRFSSAYLGWQRQLPPSRRIPPFTHTEQFSEEELVKWCKLNRVDAVISCSDTLCEVIGRHFRVPEEIAIASLDWHDSLEMAGIDQRHEMVGAAAVDILVHMLNNNLYGIPETARNTLIEGVWVSGPSAPPHAGENASSSH